jgi:integrase/recombinase XerC
MDGWRDPLQALQAYETGSHVNPCRRGRARSISGGCGCSAAWLVDGADERALGADPLADLADRDYAARDFKRFLKSERALGRASVNLALAAVDHLYRQLGLGRANVRSESLPVAAPRALSRDEQRALLRAGARDRALVVLMLFAGLRIGETVALDVDDVTISARKGVVTIRSGKGDAYREVARNALVRAVLEEWINERDGRAPDGEAALFLSAKGARISPRAADSASAASPATPASSCRRTCCVTRV